MFWHQMVVGNRSDDAVQIVGNTLKQDEEEIDIWGCLSLHWAISFWYFDYLLLYVVSLSICTDLVILEISVSHHMSSRE